MSNQSDVFLCKGVSKDKKCLTLQLIISRSLMFKFKSIESQVKWDHF